MEPCTMAPVAKSGQDAKSKDMKSKEISSKCPPLPLELWIRIIGFVTDSRYIPRAWLNFRRVSSSFKAATELAFSDRHLRNTEIIFRDYNFQLKHVPAVAAALESAGNSGELVGSAPFHLKFVLKYQGLSEDRTRAIFKREPIGEEVGRLALPEHGCTLAELAATRWQHISQSWYTAGQERLRQPATPLPAACPAAAHVITTRRVANDTALPGFQVHLVQGDKCGDHNDDIGTSGHVSVLWQPMLSQLFGEEEYIKWAKKVDYQHSPMRKNLDAISAMVRTGELPLDEFFTLMSDYTSKSSRRVLDLVRQERLRRQTACSAAEGDLSPSTPINCSNVELDVIERARESVFWAEFIDEWRFPGSEENEGNFYDGTGRLFEGNTEINKPEDDAAVQAKMEDCEVPGASWYAGSDCSEDDDMSSDW
ncbi:uncharacterized protein B0I36DRAFT_110186 [Microdochium trichocladiopsis]|uniref:Uncharacterized protein n=1 Tax=Microdochium trichocladiopsis TaxID=1682393 RepID=A0A9P9BVN8_9PEZI|nr:uncharacterized protein B0I36DRAFT_110186 [Microdochium trichocladiopsis]KAH7033522.1 hypothetical protein B0I36DRAFT_110186 [Microdochium trichocladiopsis]